MGIRIYFSLIQECSILKNRQCHILGDKLIVKTCFSDVTADCNVL